MILSLLALACANAGERDWTLPASLPVKLDGPRTWRFTVDHLNYDLHGRLTNRERVSALYTRGLPGDAVRWSDVTIAANTDGSETFPAGKKQEFMEGFTYPHSSGAAASQPEFFRNFPPMAFQARNLVWDTQMLEGFGENEFKNLKLNTPYHVQGAEEVQLAGAGAFRHKDIQLFWSGYSLRNGQKCALVDYQAFSNRLEVKTPGLTLNGLSHYWGQIWVSLATRRIEYATLYEHVAAELTVPALEKPTPIVVLRVGRFEPAVK